MNTENFSQRRFQTAAHHYLAGRAPYPASLIERVAGLLGLDQSHRVLDLGCGPAQLAVGFAPYVGEVLALDPEERMLALAHEAAQGFDNVTVSQGRSDELGEQHGRFQATMIGRAFHWMNREETLIRLNDMIMPGGAVVLFGDERPLIPENQWVRQYEALLERYSEDDTTRKTRRSDAFSAHLSVLLDSAFSNLERVSLIYRRTLQVDDLIERALSQSSTSRARLGDRATTLIEEIRREAQIWQSEAPLVEVLSSSALMARRPAEAK